MKALMQNKLEATIKAKIPVIGHDILEKVMAIVGGSFRLSSTDDYNYPNAWIAQFEVSTW